jgi:CDP-diacylglycerol--serine O-phosphatidyltransferase
MLLYFWSMQGVAAAAQHPLRGLFWGLALFYALCCAFRLARFNIMEETQPNAPYWKHFFMGIPAPGGAGLVMTPIIWQLHTDVEALQTPWIGGPVLLLCGMLMAGRWPTFSAKSLRVPVRWMIPVLLLVLFVMSMLVAQFWLTLGVVGVLYLLSVPACAIIFARLRRRHAAHTLAVPAVPPPAP